MKAEAVILFLCFSAILTAGVVAYAHPGGFAGLEKAGVNYPSVWERELPEEMQTNIANYSKRSLPIEARNTKFDNYGVGVRWKLEEVYHVEGEEYDDVVLRFAGMPYSSDKKGTSGWTVLYYSFFGDRLLEKDGVYTLSYSSDIYEVLPEDSNVRVLPQLPKSVEYYKIALPGSDKVYDRTRERDWPLYWSCRAPITKGGDIYEPYRRGVFFTSLFSLEEDLVVEKSWVLMQGFEKPRLVSKYCKLSSRAEKKASILRYLEYSVARIDDRVVFLPDDTFLFVGTEGYYPAFHIPRLKPDMSIPRSINKNYKWIRSEDVINILRFESSAIYGGRSACPLLEASHPYCIEAGEDGKCSEIEGEGLWLDYYYDHSSRSFNFKERRIRNGLSSWHSCPGMAVRDYIRGDYQVIYCREGDEEVISSVPCDERN